MLYNGLALIKRGVSHGVSGGFYLGSGVVVVSDRGRGGGGWQGAVRLGYVLPQAGRRVDGADRRCRLRPLSPLPRRRWADEGDRSAGLPLLHLLAPRAAGWGGEGQPSRAGFL